MLADLAKALGIIRGTLDVEPERVSAVDAVKVFDAFVEIERAIVAGKALFAGRAADAGVWKKEGHRSPGSWMAEVMGTGLGEANGLLETSERLGSLPETAGALRRGELSGPQLREIAGTASANPGVV